MRFDPEFVHARTWFGRLLRLPLRLIPTRSIVFIFQGPLRGKRWIAGSGTHGCWIGTYEGSKQDRFAAYIEPGMTVFDVGANVGLYTLIAADRVGPSGWVVAFEPLPTNIRFLQEHLRLNHVENRVLIREAAVADTVGEGWFETNGGKRFEGHLAEGGSLAVAITTLDTECRENKSWWPDVIKIDVEGAELEALRGARIVLEQVRPTLFLATHASEVHAACCDLLRSYGYGLESLTAAPVEHTDELLAVHPLRSAYRSAPALHDTAAAVQTRRRHGRSEKPGKTRGTVSVVIPTYNAERTLRACLESVRWADEVLVVDMFSTDATLSICADFPNVRVLQRRDYIFGNVNFGIEHAAGDWIIRHDSDEMITPGLRDEILDKIADGSIEKFDGYYVSEVVNYFGVWLPTHVPGKGGREKVFRKGAFHYPVVSEHEHPCIIGRWGYLQNVYLHDSNPTVPYLLRKTMYYAERDAERRDASTARSGWYIAYRTAKAFWSTSFRYRKRYGRLPHGLNPIISLSWAFKYLVEEAPVWQRSLRGDGDLETETRDSAPPHARDFGSNVV